MLKPHPASALEYWFFKFNYQSMALLVDWIAHRRANGGVVRISIHSPTAREVLFLDHAAILQNGATELSLEETSWQLGDVRWQLSLQASTARIRPQIFPAGQLKLFDMSLVSAPHVTFSGWIEHRHERYPVVEAPGMLSHYWGRALPRQWWWISANQFTDADIAMERMLLRSRVWGLPVEVPLGYFYYRNGSLSRLLISPPAHITLAGSPDAFEVRAVPWRGSPLKIKATGRDYVSLGEGIINTLTGNLELWQGGKLIAHALGTVGLERRAATANASA